MKSIIIIAVAFVLLIPTSIHVQESTDLVNYYENLKISGPSSEFKTIDKNPRLENHESAFLDIYFSVNQDITTY